MNNENRKLSAVSNAIRHTMDSFANGTQLIKNEKLGFTIKVANSLEEREAVFQLGYKTYLDKGYIKENISERLVQNYDADPETLILMVKNQESKVVASVTLVFDGYSRLPAEKIYHSELKKLRSNQEKIVEISRLVIDPEYRNSKEILVLLFNYLYIYAYFVKNYTCLAIEVNPRHTAYYEALLHFRTIGDEKPCPNVQSAPAILMYVSLKHGQDEISRLTNLKENEKTNRSLFSYFINQEQQNLVAYCLEKQATPISMEEKLYFGFSDSSIGRAVLA
jgi:hypothetical protein